TRLRIVLAALVPASPRPRVWPARASVHRGPAAPHSCWHSVHSTTGRKFELMHYPKISNIVICDRGHHGKESAKLFALHRGAAAEYGWAASPKHGLHKSPPE